jgi:hypothetical protein
MDNWDQEAIDLVQPGFIEFGEDGLGSLGFIVVTGELDCRDADRDGQPGVEFSWQGSDEGDDASGRGWAALNPGSLLPRFVSKLPPNLAVIPGPTARSGSGSREHRSGQPVLHGLRSRRTNPPGHDSTEGGPPPLRRRSEWAVAWIQGGG